MIKGTFTAYDGKRIAYREWQAENPKGMLQISHGMAESISRYNGLAEYMSANGFIVFGDDHRGHGETDPGRTGYSDGDMYNDTVEDIATLARIYKEKYPDLPLVLFGHSYGSFLTQAYMEKHADLADGFIVGGSAYMNDITVVVGRIISKINCFFGGKKKPAKFLAKMSFGMYNKKLKEGTFISSIPEECERYEKDPDCNFVLSYNFYKYFFKGLPKNYSKKNAAKIDADKPVLLISGKDDPVGGMGKLVDKLEKFYTEKVGVKEVKKVLYDGVRHEYLNDTSKDAARAEILAFVSSVGGKKA